MRPKMRRHCSNCKSHLRVWETRCPCCRTSAMRWLHLFAVAAASLSVVFYLLATAR
jgi:predicted amidophosphoribosyltransferase